MTARQIHAGIAWHQDCDDPECPVLRAIDQAYVAGARAMRVLAVMAIKRARLGDSPGEVTERVEGMNVGEGA